MSTTAQSIIDAAIDSALGNDAGIADDVTELVGVISRVVRQTYTIAGTPSAENGWGDGFYFIRSADVTIGTPATTPVAFAAPEPVHIVSLTNAAGARVNVVSARDDAMSRAIFPPAVVITENKIRSRGRTGDPAAASTVTINYSYLPDVLTDPEHFVGATTLTDSTTSAWPGHVGDPFLIDALALYLAMKDDARRDVGALQASLQDNAGLLATAIRVNKATLSRIREG